MQSQALNRFLDERQTSQYTAIAVKTLQRWRCTGDGPPYKKLNGKAVRYDVADLDAWIATQPSGGQKVGAR